MREYSSELFHVFIRVLLCMVNMIEVIPELVEICCYKVSKLVCCYSVNISMESDAILSINCFAVLQPWRRF